MTYNVEIKTRTSDVVGTTYSVIVSAEVMTMFGVRPVVIHSNSYKTLKGAQANAEMLKVAYNVKTEGI